MLLLAGCAAPAPEAQPPTPVADGPVDLTGRLGLFVVDLETRRIDAYTEQPSLAWMSPDAQIVTWTESDFNVVVNRTTGARELGPRVAWARILSNGTALELTPAEARLRPLVGSGTLWSAPLPPAPLSGGAWSGASDDLDVLGAEFPGAGRASCGNDVFVMAQRLERTVGCHLRVAPDGRAGWTEAAGVRVRERAGAITNLTGPGSGNAANGTFVTHENPAFTRDGLLMLRITGGDEITSTEIVAANGTALAKMTGSRPLALHDVSDDGRFVLVRAFER